MNTNSLLLLFVSLLLTFQLSSQAKVVKVIVPDQTNTGVLQNYNQGNMKTVTSKTTVIKTVTTTSNVEPTLVQPVYTQTVTEPTIVQPIYTQSVVSEPTYGRKRRNV